MEETLSAFATDLDDMLGLPVVAWAFGHTHWHSAARQADRVDALKISLLRLKQFGVVQVNVFECVPCSTNRHALYRGSQGHASDLAFYGCES